MLKAAEKAVIAVVAYSAQFDHPLTLSEIHERLLSKQGLQFVDQTFKTSQLIWPATPLAAKEQLASLLQSLVQKKLLIQRQRFFTLKGKRQAFKKRRLATLSQRAKKELIVELIELVQKIPWILGVAITGSHAAGGAMEKDDVDFLVVTAKNRLWLARLLLLFYSWRRGRRPNLPSGDISHSWDLNFWLDETRLALPKQKQSTYEAYEVLQTRWVFNRASIRERFLSANPWVGRYLAAWHLPTKKTTQLQEKFDWLALFNTLAFIVEVGYRHLRHGRQRADLHSAFFHPTQTKNDIFLAWKSLYQQAQGKTVVLATGVFDVLHKEHKNFLRAAKKTGDFLVVGLESDERVRAIKGNGRPVNPQLVRLANLQQWRLADEIFILPVNFDQKAEREKLIAQLHPQVLAVSSHTPHLEEKSQILKKYGGKVKIVYQHRQGVSSSHIIKQQKQG